MTTMLIDVTQKDLLQNELLGFWYVLEGAYI